MNGRTMLNARACAVLAMAVYCLVAAPAAAITAGPGLINYAADMRRQCLSTKSPEPTLSACRAALTERMPPEDRPEVFLAMARAYGMLHQTGAALQAYDAVVAVAPQEFEALAGGCWIRGLLNVELARALDQCQQALLLDPGDAQIFLDRCLVRFRMGDFAKADADCSGAAHFRPIAPRALYIRGLIRMKSGNGSAGNADLAAAGALDPEVAKALAADGLAP